ncbi:MAG: hypothetical protein EA341_05680 [Mongoliibacter sp.]|nr:MAG: hypothetical protein EA341_05680 [Mongoliibacter sp.]
MFLNYIQKTIKFVGFRVLFLKIVNHICWKAVSKRQPFLSSLCKKSDQALETDNILKQKN